jgi:hypothetical protein
MEKKWQPTAKNWKVSFRKGQKKNNYLFVHEAKWRREMNRWYRDFNFLGGFLPQGSRRWRETYLQVAKDGGILTTR